MNKLTLYTQDRFDALREQTDPLADEAVVALVNYPELVILMNSWTEIPKDLPQNLPVALINYLSFYQKMESSAPSELLKKGQDFFEEKGDLYLAMLGFYSLPYCYAFADGAQVLVRSRRILDQIGERLGETGSFLLELFRPGAFQGAKQAFLVCAKVRLIHAFSRYFIRMHARDWDPAFGQPINQEDLIGTNLAFSLMVLRGFRKMGVKLTEEETSTVLSYWHWVGQLMGLDVDYWPTNSKEAFELERLIRKRHLNYSKAGETLTRALIDFYEESIPDPLLSRQAESIVSFFLGEEASAAVNIQQKFSIQGDLLGLLFRFTGFQTYRGKKDFRAIERQFALNQEERFGKVLHVALPVLTRS